MAAENVKMEGIEFQIVASADSAVSSLAALEAKLQSLSGKFSQSAGHVAAFTSQIKSMADTIDKVAPKLSALFSGKTIDQNAVSKSVQQATENVQKAVENAAKTELSGKPVDLSGLVDMGSLETLTQKIEQTMEKAQDAVASGGQPQNTQMAETMQRLGEAYNELTASVNRAAQSVHEFNAVRPQSEATEQTLDRMSRLGEASERAAGAVSGTFQGMSAEAVAAAPKIELLRVKAEELLGALSDLMQKAPGNRGGIAEMALQVQGVKDKISALEKELGNAKSAEENFFHGMSEQAISGMSELERMNAKVQILTRNLAQGIASGTLDDKQIVTLSEQIQRAAKETEKLTEAQNRSKEAADGLLKGMNFSDISGLSKAELQYVKIYEMIQRIQSGLERNQYTTEQVARQMLQLKTAQEQMARFTKNADEASRAVQSAFSGMSAEEVKALSELQRLEIEVGVLNKKLEEMLKPGSGASDEQIIRVNEQIRKKEELYRKAAAAARETAAAERQAAAAGTQGQTRDAFERTRQATDGATESARSFFQGMSAEAAAAMPKVELLRARLELLRRTLAEKMSGENLIDDNEIISLIERIQKLEEQIRKFESAETEAERGSRSLFEGMSAEAVESLSKVELLRMRIEQLRNELREGLDNGTMDDSQIISHVERMRNLEEQYQRNSNASTKLQSAMKGISAVIGVLKTVFNDFMQIIQREIKVLYNFARVVGGTLYGALFKAAGAAASFAKAIGGKLTSAAGGAVKSTRNLVRTLLTLPFRPLGNAAQRASEQLTPFLAALKRISLYRMVRFVLSNITQAFKEGIDNLYEYSRVMGTTFHNAMDSLATDALYLKNSLGAMAAPLIEALAPAIDYITEKLVNLFNLIGMIFAKLTGKDTYTRAIKKAVEYGDATEEAAQKQKDFMLGLDELNVFKEDSGSGSDMGSEFADMFEEVPIDNIGDLFGEMFDPFKKAWENVGQQTVDSIKYAFDELKQLGKSVGESFKEVWLNGTGQETIEDLLLIVGNVSTAVGNLAGQFRIAWDTAGLGTSIVQHVWDILNLVLGTAVSITGEFAKWTDTLDFTGLLTSLNYALGQAELLIGAVADSIKTVFASETMAAMPQKVLDIYEKINKIVGNLAGKLREAWMENDNGTRILQAIVEIFDDILDIVMGIGDAMINWTANIDFTDLFGAVATALEKIEGLVDSVGKSIVAAFNSEEAAKTPQLIADIFTNLVTIVGNLAESLQIAWDENGTGTKILIDIIEILNIILDTAKRVTAALVEWSANLDLTDELATFEEALQRVKEIVQLIGDCIVAIFEGTDAPFYELGRKITEFLSDIIRSINEHLENDENRGAVGHALGKLFNGAVDGMDWEALGRFMMNMLLSTLDDVAGFVAESDPVKVGTAIATFINSAFARLQEWLDEGHLQDIANWIETTLVTLISNLDFEKDLGTLGEFVATLINALADAIIKADWEDVGEALGAALSKVDWGKVAKATIDLRVGTFIGFIKGLFENPNGRVFLALYLGIKGLKWIFSSGNALKFARTVGSFVATAFAPLITSGGESGVIGKAFGAAKTAVGKGGAAIGTALGAAKTLIVPVAAGLVTAIAGSFSYSKLKENAEATEMVLEAHTHEVDTKLADYTKLYEECGKDVADQWALMVTGIDTSHMDINEALDAIREDVDKQFEGVPESIWDGFKRGWDEYFGEDGAGLLAYVGDQFKALVDHVKGIFGINSPSKVFIEIGENVGAGFDDGVDNGFKDIDTTMRGITEDVISAFDNLGNDVSDAVEGDFEDVGKNAGGGFFGGLSDKMNGAKTWIETNVTGPITDFANKDFGIESKGSSSTVFKSIGESVLLGLRDGIQFALDLVIDVIEHVAERITGTLEEKFNKISDSADDLVESLNHLKDSASETWGVIQDGKKKAEELSTAAKDLKTVLLTELKSALDDLTAKFKTVWEEIDNGKKKFETITSEAKTCSDTLNDTFVPALDTTKDHAEKAFQTLSESGAAFDTVDSSAFKFGETLLNKVAPGFETVSDRAETSTDRLKTVRETINETKGDASDFAKMLSKEVADALKTLADKTDAANKKLKDAKDRFEKVGPAAETMAKKLDNKAIPAFDHVIDKTGKVNDALDACGEKFDELTATIDEAATEIERRIDEMAENVKQSVEDMQIGVSSSISTMATDFEQQSYRVDQALWGISGTASNTLGSVSSQASTWGRDLAQNFADGIRNNTYLVANAATDMAQVVQDRDGFSEPKTGPLSDFHTYAPDMMKLFAQGILQNENLVTDQVENAFDIRETMEGLFREAWEGVEGVFLEAGTFFADTFGTAVESARAPVMGLVDIFKDAMAESFTIADNGVVDVSGVIENGLNNLDVEAEITAGAVQNTFSQLWEQIYQDTHTTWTSMEEFFLEIWGKILTEAEASWQAIQRTLEENWGKIKENAVDVWTNFSVYLSSIWAKVEEDTESSWKRIEEQFAGVWANISTATQGAWNGILAYLNDVWEQMRVGGENAWTSVKEVSDSLLTEISDRVSDWVNEVIKGLNRLASAVSSFAARVGKNINFGGRDFATAFGVIPRYATGGFPEDGLFYANHGEMIGRFENGKTAVANNGQIVDGISDGVSRANEAVVATLLDLISAVEQKDTGVYIGDREIGRSYDRYTTSRGYRVNSGAFANAY